MGFITRIFEIIAIKTKSIALLSAIVAGVLFVALTLFTSNIPKNILFPAALVMLWAAGIAFINYNYHPRKTLLSNDSESRIKKSGFGWEIYAGIFFTFWFGMLIIGTLMVLYSHIN